MKEALDKSTSSEHLAEMVAQRRADMTPSLCVYSLGRLAQLRAVEVADMDADSAATFPKGLV